MNKNSTNQAGRVTPCAPFFGLRGQAQRDPALELCDVAMRSESAGTTGALPAQSIGSALLFVIVCLVYFVVNSPALAQQPSAQLIPFQGRLTDQLGRGYTNPATRAPTTITS